MRKTIKYMKMNYEFMRNEMHNLCIYDIQIKMNA